MRVFVCGSLYQNVVTDPERRQAVAEAARAIGRQLGREQVTLLVGTDRPESVDKHVVEGALASVKDGKHELRLEVYYIRSESHIPFSDLVKEPGVTVRFHKVESDEWHVAHMGAVEDCDCVLLLAGRTGTLVSGLTSMLHGVPFLPLAFFNHGAEDVWSIARHNPTRYFFDALTRDEVDALSGAWDAQRSPETIVANLRKLVAKKRRVVRDTGLSKVMAVCGMLLGIGLYLLGLYQGQYSSLETGLFWLALCSGAAGIAGSGLAVLWARGYAPVLSPSDSGVRVAMGIGGGFLAFLLLLAAQFLAKGYAEMKIEQGEYLRFAILAGLFGTYGGLCTHRILERFIRRADAVLDESESV